MKKITLCLMTAFLSLTFLPTQTQAATEPIATTCPATKSVEANVLLLRLNEIQSIDKSKMTSTEKKKLNNEVRSIKNKLKVLDGGIYLSVGAIIIILLLLILLL